MAKGSFTNLSFRAGTTNTESGVVDRFSKEARPKLKFNFTISFKFRRPIQVVGTTNKPEGAFMADELTFALKQASRPNPTVIFQDVNYYNFRTKVGVKVDYGTVQLQFYDDVENFGHNVFETYLKSISPIASIDKKLAEFAFKNTRINGPQNKNFNLHGIIAGDDTIIDGGTGSIGPLPFEAELGILENITLRHWFFSEKERRFGEETSIAGFIGPQQEANPDNIQYVEYQFLNPKIVNMTLDDLDMTQSEASTIMMNFVYDSVFINSPNSSNARPSTPSEGDGKTFTLNDVLSRTADIERLVARIRRLDTVPDISILEVANAFVPPISGNLPNIQLPKPVVDVFDILGL